MQRHLAPEGGTMGESGEELGHERGQVTLCGINVERQHEIDQLGLALGVVEFSRDGLERIVRLAFRRQETEYEPAAERGPQPGRFAPGGLPEEKVREGDGGKARDRQSDPEG